MSYFHWIISRVPLISFDELLVWYFLFTVTFWQNDYCLATFICFLSNFFCHYVFRIIYVELTTRPTGQLTFGAPVAFGNNPPSVFTCFIWTSPFLFNLITELSLKFCFFYSCVNFSQVLCQNYWYTLSSYLSYETNWTGWRYLKICCI